VEELTAEQPIFPCLPYGKIEVIESHYH